MKLNRKANNFFELAHLLALAGVLLLCIFFCSLYTISSEETSKSSIARWKSAWCLQISEDYLAQREGRMCGCVLAQIFSVNPFLIGLLLSSVLPALL